MTRLAEIEGRIASMDELNGIVAAMRSLAGMRMQEAQRALPGVRRYAQSMANAIGSILNLVNALPSTSGAGSRALVVLMAEHGFVGGFNERLIETVKADLTAQDKLYVLGSRGAVLLAELGLKPVWLRAIATRIAGAPESADALASALYGAIAHREIANVEIIHHRFRQGGSAEIVRRTLLPVDLASLQDGQSTQPPVYNLDPEKLLDQLMAEFVFALLTEAVVESVSSENAARFAAMESAHDNVSQKLDQLRQSARTARQDDITAELLDLIIGAESQDGRNGIALRPS